MGGPVFPPCCLTWGQTVVEVMKKMATSFKRSHAGTAALSAPDPAAGHCWPNPPLPLLDTHGQVWVSLSWGHCSFLLGPSAHKVLFVPSKSLFPQSYVSSGGSMVGLMVTSSKRAYATPRSATPRATPPAAGHCWSIPLQETLKHSKASFAQSLWCLLVCTRFCLSALSVSGGYGSLLTQDGVEGCVLIFSCKNSKITTRCWTTTDRRMLDPTKKSPTS